MDKLIGSHIHDEPLTLQQHALICVGPCLYYTGLQLVESMDVEPGLLKASSYGDF